MPMPNPGQGESHESSPMSYERLTTPLEIKSLSGMQFEGYGAVFGNQDYGGDIVMPGAFAKSLEEHRSNRMLPLMFWMHDKTRIPGKWLDMREDGDGLMAKGELAPTDLGKELHTLLKMEAVRGLSIGYIPTQKDYTSDGARLLKQVHLVEVSIVALPLNPKAQITQVKSRLSARGEYVPTDQEIAELKRDAERYLQSRGFNARLAKQCAANIFQEFASSATPGSKDDPKRDVEDRKQSTPSATPDELEVNAGLTGFKERLLLQDLELFFQRYFKEIRRGK